MHFTSYFISFRENFLSLLTFHSMCSTWVPHNFWSIYSHNAEVKGDAKVSIKVKGKKRASTLIPWHSSQSVKWTLFSYFIKIYFDSKLFPSPASMLFIFFHWQKQCDYFETAFLKLYMDELFVSCPDDNSFTHCF